MTRRDSSEALDVAEESASASTRLPLDTITDAEPRKHQDANPVDEHRTLGSSSSSAPALLKANTVDDTSRTNERGEFAPGDLTDQRGHLQWKSRWDPDALKLMNREAKFLAFVLFLGTASFTYGIIEAVGNTQLSEKSRLVHLLMVVWGAGLIGGTCFGIKWFYHMVAKGYWNSDRQYWRFFSPAVSSLLAVFVTIGLLSEELAGNTTSGFQQSALKAGLYAFLAGCFSDSAFAKLAEIARVIFGVTEKHQPVPKPSDNGDRRDSFGAKGT